jgi:hypothetical protein
MTRSRRIKYVCEDCGSDNITWTADVYFNEDEQRFEICNGSLHDEPWCSRCDERTGDKRLDVILELPEKVNAVHGS